jgi:hypothetical protein
MSDKEILGGLSLIISAAAYAPYIWSMFRRQIRPHLFSWIVWSLISLIAYLAQTRGNAGPGSWAVGFSGLCTVIIALCSLRYGERHITRFDWVCFVGALLAIPLWRLSSNPTASLVLVLAIDSLAYGMTFRKSWIKPYSENVVVYLLDTVKYGAAILALEHYSLLTILFPLYIIVVEAALAALILLRRRAKAAVGTSVGLLPMHHVRPLGGQ